ncbi:MAG TPA: Asp-tRNA(Asn)/Glu-tRNA(Gln) amidotransferase subunit GatB [Gemmatimonadaceae bacterium]|nr:Asp-tRNA(Asn)/Glu-tRNA(Gln) amidotransferase subunit GatB [Gemmatimonadaceae bacterium]
MSTPKSLVGSATLEPSPVRTKYEMVVGLETHVQLLTNTKAFCSCSSEFGASPNTNVCPVCLGLPGALPVLNERVVDLALRAALALECEIHPISIFARKNYFYPDLPKGYQISQYDRPIATAGHLTIDAGGGASARVGVTRVHIEEDAGKSVHDRYAGATAIDLNRAGVPLIEIVTEPDIRSSAAAGAYLRALKQLLEFLEVSDVNMEEGSLRVDANISARLAGESTFGTKTEVKNLNSFSAVERALEAEFSRQIAVLEAGQRVLQQTMLWDADTSTVRPARSKEESHDYRYFPDPDLPPLVIELAAIEKARRDLPELPRARRERYRERFALSAYDAEVLTATRSLGNYFEDVVKQHGDAKTAANWMMGEVMASLKTTKLDIEHFPIRPAELAELLDLVRDNVLSGTAAKRVFAIMASTGERAPQIAQREGLVQVRDDAPLRAWIEEVIAEHEAEARRLANGERKLLGVLVGFVMKKSSGRADPRRVNQLLAERLGV